MLPRMWGNVREWTSALPSELPTWELESWLTFESSKSNCKGENSLDWRVSYIIGNLLELTWWSIEGKNRLKRAIQLLRLLEKRHLLKQKRFRRCFNGSRCDPKRGSGQSELVYEVCLLFYWIVPWSNLLEGFLWTWEITKDGWIWAIINGERITIDQTLIAKQFNVSVEGAMDATNALVKKTQMASKNIIGLDAFVNKEQWSIIRMKEEYHARFATILQIIYQCESLTYFCNHIAITLNFANKGKKINECSIMLTQMSIKLTQWTEHKNK